MFIVNDSKEKKKERRIYHFISSRWKFTGIAWLQKQKKYIFKHTRYAYADSDSRAVYGVGLRSLASWDRGFESC